MTAVVSWFPISTSGMESAPSAPSASGEKQVVQEPKSTSCPLLSSPHLVTLELCSSSFSHAYRLFKGEEPQQIFADRKMVHAAQLLQISKASL